MFHSTEWVPGEHGFQRKSSWNLPLLIIFVVIIGYVQNAILLPIQCTTFAQSPMGGDPEPYGGGGGGTQSPKGGLW